MLTIGALVDMREKIAFDSVGQPVSGSDMLLIIFWLAVFAFLLIKLFSVWAKE